MGINFNTEPETVKEKYDHFFKNILNGEYVLPWSIIDLVSKCKNKEFDKLEKIAWLNHAIIKKDDATIDIVKTQIEGLEYMINEYKVSVLILWNAFSKGD